MQLNLIHEIKDYGQIKFVINKIMDKKNVTIYQLSKATGLRYESVKKYYNNKHLTRIDFDVLAKLCCTLNCEVSDIIEFKKANYKVK